MNNAENILTANKATHELLSGQMSKLTDLTSRLGELTAANQPQQPQQPRQPPPPPPPPRRTTNPFLPGFPQSFDTNLDRMPRGMMSTHPKLELYTGPPQTTRVFGQSTAAKRAKAESLEDGVGGPGEGEFRKALGLFPTLKNKRIISEGFESLVLGNLTNFINSQSSDFKDQTLGIFVPCEDSTCNQKHSKESILRTIRLAIAQAKPNYVRRLIEGVKRRRYQ
uniref:Uncharacterized protein n=1 Tax=Dikerogammarus haemobaphes virus 1 TaxID=2704946 RepID=A0A6G9HDJ1_9VIRU|nr:hypothetical protein [Dikerogammarus haemobaphes virus 1]